MQESAPKIPHAMTPNEAILEVKNIEGQVFAMGGNDYEFNAFKQIEEGVMSGKITPEDAVAQAHSILETKNSNYH